MWTTLLDTHVHMTCGRFLKAPGSKPPPVAPSVRSGCISPACARSCAPSAAGLEFRLSVIECRGGGAPQCPLKNPRHRGRVQSGLWYVFPRLTLRNTARSRCWPGTATAVRRAACSRAVALWRSRLRFPAPPGRSSTSGSIMVIPWAWAWRCSQRIAANSDRRRPPANPITIKARSGTPSRDHPPRYPPSAG